MQFSMSTQFSPIQHIGRTLSSATTPGQNEPGTDNHKRLLQH